MHLGRKQKKKITEIYIQLIDPCTVPFLHYTVCDLQVTVLDHTSLWTYYFATFMMKNHEFSVHKQSKIMFDWSAWGYYWACETLKTVNTRIIYGMLLFCEE